MTTQYRACRWYDPYPKLVFVLQLIRLLPVRQQESVGRQLRCFLEQPLNTPPEDIQLSYIPTWSNRWYDGAPHLADGLERLRQASQNNRLKGTDFLSKLLQVEQNAIESNNQCA